MNGAKTRRFFKKMSKSPMQVSKASVDLTSDKRWELWKDLCLCTTDKDPNVEVANQRKLVWSSFQKVVQLMNLSSTTAEQREEFKKVLYEFTKAAKDGWFESKITHYKYIVETGMYPREPTPLQELREEMTASHPWKLIATTTDKCQFFMLLLKLMNAKNALELGVYRGCSLLRAALALPLDGKVLCFHS
ncbi:hypothetical protein L7F22_055412 [Adiantum nelumboides]|nr:hypothetical protein [Adiantum nelumboides]